MVTTTDSTMVLLQKRQMLAEAEMALHKLSIGGQRQQVNFGAGKGVTYTSANIADLRRYIQDLKAEIAALDGSLPTRGPIRIIY